MPLGRRKFIKAGVIATGALFLLDIFWAEKYFIETKRFRLGKASESDFDIKVIQISDLHLQNMNPQLKKLAQTINAENPDLLLITGDSVDNAKKTHVLQQLLSIIRYDIRKLAILGNWEYWGKVDMEELKLTYSLNNAVLLINEGLQFSIRGKTICVTGVDDFVGGKADIEKAVSNYASCNYHIVLNHCPQYADTISEKLKNKIPVDFILSGHTHGGQINFFGFIPFLPQGSGPYVKGWYQTGGTSLYVSKGIGTSIFPARFMARAEMAIFKLKS